MCWQSPIEERPGHLESHGFFTSEAFILHQIVFMLDRLARQEVLDRLGVSYNEFLVMMMVRELPGPNQGDICDALDLSRSQVSQRVSALREKGMLNQRRDPKNRRQVRLALTPKGQSLLAEIYAGLTIRAGAVFDRLGPGRASFRGALQQVAAALAAELRLERRLPGAEEGRDRS